MKKKTYSRTVIQDIEKIQNESNDPGEQILAALEKRELCQKFIYENYSQPKEL